MQPGLFDSPIPAGMRNLTVTDRLAKSILTPAQGRLEGFDFSLNPYVGCGFGCSYCYAAFFIPDEARAAEWGQWVEVKTNAVDRLLRTKGVAGARIYIGSVTDPYQPIERETQLTRSLLECLAEFSPQPRVVIQTRSDLPMRDIELFQRFHHLRVNFSITTDDDTVRKRYEPACLSIERRLRAAETLVQAGVAVNLCLCPLLPVTDVKGFAERLQHVGAGQISVSPFHETRGRFAAGTGQRAWDLAREDGWDDRAYRAVVQQLKAELPELDETGLAFTPA